MEGYSSGQLWAMVVKCVSDYTPASGQDVIGPLVYTAIDYKVREQDGPMERMEKETKDLKFQCPRTVGFETAQFC